MAKAKIDPFLRCNGLPICKEEDWFTPHTYNRNYKKIPESAGVYLILGCQDVFDMHKREVVYIGSSKNLAQRYRVHDTIPKIRLKYRWIFFYFKETEDYISFEKELIFKFNPKFNIKYRNLYV